MPNTLEFSKTCKCSRVLFSSQIVFRKYLPSWGSVQNVLREKAVRKQV